MTPTLQPDAPLAGIQLTGNVHGGQQPVSSALIQLYAVSISGDAYSSTPLISQPVRTSSQGSFSITGDYTCPSSSSLVYITATGGNPGLSPGTNNSAISLMTALGPCGNLSPETFIELNELTTVASVFSLAPFMSSYSAVGSSSSDVQALQTAFATVSQLVNTAAGTTPGTGMPAGSLVPVPQINTLADIFAACVNSSGGVAGDGSACGQLFQFAHLPGSPAPTDIVGAALRIASNPSNNVASIFTLSPANGPFQPSLAAAPFDWKVTPLGSFYHAFGDSITYGDGVTDMTQIYPALVSQALGIAGTDYAIGGDMACDVPTRQIFPNAENPTLQAKSIYSLLISTNDVDNKGTGAYEPVFNLCHQASISWLALPAKYKIPALSNQVISSGSVSADLSNNWNALVTQEQNASITFPISRSTPGPVYVWYRLIDGNPGTFTYALDGNVLGSASTGTTPTISTRNGSNNSLALLRLPTVAAGDHLLTLTQTSTGAAGMSVVAIGIPPSTAPSNMPEVLVGITPPQLPGYGACGDTDAPCQIYIADITANATLLAGDGLDVRLFDSRKYLTADPADFADPVHPNLQGHLKLFQSVRDVY